MDTICKRGGEGGFLKVNFRRQKFLKMLNFLLFTTFVAVSQETDAIGFGQTYQSLYERGVDAYMNEKWNECLYNLDRAIRDYRVYHEQLGVCRIRCQEAGHLRVDEKNFLEHIYLEACQRKSACIKNCTGQAFPDRQAFHGPPTKLREIEHHFQNLDTYDYIQMCAFKEKRFELAFSAAFTFAVARPNHPYAQINLEFYKKLSGGRVELFRNLELKPHQELRREAVALYDNGDWLGATEKFEESLASFFEAEERCSVECDDFLDEPHFSEFHRKVSEAKSNEEARYHLANHWLKLLSCRDLCSRKLSTIDGVPLDGFFLDHYHYLQYCYYKVGNAARAMKSVASFLLFSPKDSNQLHNKMFYTKQGLSLQDDFVPREDARKLFERRSLDWRMKRIAEDEFLLHRGKSNYKPFTFKSPDVYSPRSEEYNRSFSSALRSLGVSLVSMASRRVVADGLADPHECLKLIQLANLGKRDKIVRMTMSKAAEMVRDGKASAEQVSTFMNLSDRARHLLEKHHNLKVPLLFQRTQLTYRAPGSEQGTSDNMTLEHFHPCSIDPDIFCTGAKGKDFLAYLQLDDKEDVGGFHFVEGDDDDKVVTTVKPKQGRLIALTADDGHHLDRVGSTHKYALVMWFTLSPAHQELDHAEARTILRIVQGGNAKTSKISLDSLDYMKSKHYALSLDEEDLNGEERFAADGLATEKECQALIRLTNSFGSLGSGYGSGFSHTTHESFMGVTIGAATELAQNHRVSPEDVKLYLRLSNEMKELTRRVLVGRDRSLYFSFTHLVCRTALNDENVDRTDLSHPIHSDNCIIQEDYTCKKVRPAYIERDYSAILYLNEDFTGGDFFFAHQNMSVQSSVKPKCGRVVSFNSGHYHGVKPVLSGQRCAVAIWFTLDSKFDETSHPVAEGILEKLTNQAHDPVHFHAEL